MHVQSQIDARRLAPEDAGVYESVVRQQCADPMARKNASRATPEAQLSVTRTAKNRETRSNEPPSPPKSEAQKFSRPRTMNKRVSRNDNTQQTIQRQRQSARHSKRDDTIHSSTGQYTSAQSKTLANTHRLHQMPERSRTRRPNDTTPRHRRRTNARQANSATLSAYAPQQTTDPNYFAPPPLSQLGPFRPGEANAEVVNRPEDTQDLCPHDPTQHAPPRNCAKQSQPFQKKDPTNGKGHSL